MKPWDGDRAMLRTTVERLIVGLQKSEPAPRPPKKRRAPKRKLEEGLKNA